MGADDRFGKSLAVIGDVNHDGIDDIAIGSHLDDDGGTNKGAIYILMLNKDGSVKEQQKISRISGNGPNFETSHYYFGSSIAELGDLNGDGNVDIAVGMYGGEDGGASGYDGAVWILFLNDDGTVLEYRKISNNEGGGPRTLENYDYFGIGLSNIGDINGDNIPDIAIRASGDDDGGANKGAIYIGFLDYNGTLKDIHKISDTSGDFIDTLTTNESVGTAYGIGDLNKDGINDIIISSVGNDDGGTNRGAFRVCFMERDGSVSSMQRVSDTTGGFTGVLDDGDSFGEVIDIGDIDGDNIRDIAVTAAWDDDGVTDGGALWVLYMNSNGTVKSHNKIACDDSLLINEVEENDRFLTSISYFGDRNNDGQPDFLIGAWDATDSNSINSGEIYIVHTEGDTSYPNRIYHNSPHFITGLKQHYADIGVYADEIYHNDNYGISASSISDLDGDGIDDLVVGAHGDNYSGGADLGSVFIEFLNADGSIKTYQKITGTLGGFGGSLDYSDYFGYSVCSVGDLNGDGNDDIAVGAVGDDDGGTGRGAVWILFLKADGTVKSEQKISDTEGNFTGLLSNSDQFGVSISKIGDLNNDGINDLAVGAHGDDDGETNTGAVWILFLDTNGTVKSEQKISNFYGSLPDTLYASDQFGYSVAGLGDIDGDNIPDIAVGARLDDSTAVNSGAIYILMMTDSGHVKVSKKIVSGTVEI